MPSIAFGEWAGPRVSRLDELERVHRELTGGGPGRRWVTDQLDRAYVVALASQFQGFCRDLHSEAAAAVAATVPAALRPVVEGSLTLARTLDRGNPNAGNLGSDFGRFGFDFWPAVYAADVRNQQRRARLDQVMIWRNAIAHDSRMSSQDQAAVTGTAPTLGWGRRWRSALAALVQSVDLVIAHELEPLLGRLPW